MMEKRREERKHSAKFLRRRKFLLVLPALVLPFLLLLVWTLGIVGEAKASKKETHALQGLNLNLPSAAPAKDSNWNKLRYYEQADRDSAKIRSLLKKDPYQRSALAGQQPETEMSSLENNTRSVFNPYPASQIPDSNEKRVYQKINALHQQLEIAEVQDRQPKKEKEVIKRKSSLPSTDVERLETMMHSMQHKEVDSEMVQLSGILEKIMDVQNPQRVHEKLEQQSLKNRKQVFSIEQSKEDYISVLETKKDFTATLQQYHPDSMPETMRSYMETNRFYGIEEKEFNTITQHAIRAVIDEDQTLVNGATVKLRLREDMLIAGNRIAKDQFVYGMATLDGERLLVAITSIGYRNQLLPVNLSVYDYDGLAGINIPGAMTRTVAKRSAAQSAQNIGALNTLDPSFGAQAVSAGLNMAQNIVGKSAKLVRVSIQAGYGVLLKDENAKDK